jgi:exonuclease III
MKILSFNCRGLVNPNKKSSLRRLVEQCSPDVILLQETLGENLAVVKILESLLLGWMFTAVDAREHSKSNPLKNTSWGNSLSFLKAEKFMRRSE